MIRPFLKFLLLALAPLAVKASAIDARELLKGSRPIGRSISILEDPQSTLSPEKAFRSDGFIPSQLDVPNLGSSGSAFWLRCSFDRSALNEPLVLEIPHPEIDELDIFHFKNGQLLLLVHNGQARQFADLIPAGRKFIFQLPAGTEQLDLLIRVKSIKQLQVPLILRTASQAAEVSSDRRSYVGVFIGMMLVLAFYNFFIY